MFLFLAILAGIVVSIYPPLSKAFLANAAINGLICSVLLIGIIYVFRQVMKLYPEITWIKNFNIHTKSSPTSPNLLGPMLTLLRKRKDKISLTTLGVRSILDGVLSRLDESREISRYLIGLLIFLGLLGTFWGLLETVNAVGLTISSLEISDGDLNEVFGGLKSGLESPLSGMGTAFSSSMFGLAGSLILGFLDLQANQAQNRFFKDLEDWLAKFTHLPTGGTAEEGQASSVYVEALLEQTADNLESLGKILAKSEEKNANLNENIVKLNERLNVLVEGIGSGQTKFSKELRDEIKILTKAISSLGSKK